MNIIRETACLVLNPVNVYSSAKAPIAANFCYIIFLGLDFHFYYVIFLLIGMCKY